jgi:predicted DCC family thiol-disulfide oxidoreductase YuxK
MNSGPILLYDGVCGLCEAWVPFIIDHDPEGRFRFAPLQSDIGRQLLEQHHLEPGMNTLVLIDQGQAYVRSAAAIRIGMLLGHGFSLLAEALAVIPESLRDGVYNWIARNRYRLFGKHDACRLPAAHLATRFLS